MAKIAFDLDDTLIIPAIATGFERDVPNYQNIQIFHWFQEQGHYIIVWSGGGVDYVQAWMDRLGLAPDEICKKGEKEVDIAFDDADVQLGKVNIKVKRHNNSIQRY
ncbi:MAG: hypothetical protein ACOCQ4_01695 [bacterium]